jgi:hypothetical protein
MISLEFVALLSPGNFLAEDVFWAMLQETLNQMVGKWRLIIKKLNE